jgi:hypothetical protein
MTTTTAPVRPHRRHPPRLEWIAPGVLLIAAALLGFQLSLSEPTRRSIRVDNGTGAFVTIHAAGRTGGWVGLGTVDPMTHTTFDEVSDQGELWRFKLSVGPDQIGELRRTGRQLQDAAWRITIPPNDADGLSISRRPGDR